MDPDAPANLKTSDESVPVTLPHAQPNTITAIIPPENNTSSEEKKGFLKSLIGYFKKTPQQIQDEQMQNNGGYDEYGRRNELNDESNKNYDDEQTNEEDEDSEIHLSLCGHLVKLVDGEQ